LAGPFLSVRLARDQIGYALPNMRAFGVSQLGERPGTFTGIRSRCITVSVQMRPDEDLQLQVRHVVHGKSPFFLYLMPQRND
jgi:hypothetical protein